MPDIATATVDGTPLGGQHLIVKRYNRTLAVIALALASACSAESSAPSLLATEASPAATLEPTGFVTDAATILDEEQEAALTAKLQDLQLATGHQFVVVSVPDLGGEDVVTFTENLANRWRVGRAGQNDGVVLLLSVADRRARIAVGYGLQQELTDTYCQQVMDQHIIPRFRQGDLPGGINAGVDAILARLRSVHRNGAEEHILFEVA